jgi:predicted MFS family arabinose efflux permease
MLISGAAWLLAFSTFNIAVQMAAPGHVAGRALSLYQMNSSAGLALGSWLWGLAAERAGVRTALMGAAVVMVLCALSGRVLSVDKVETMS